MPYGPSAFAVLQMTHSQHQRQDQQNVGRREVHPVACIKLIRKQSHVACHQGAESGTGPGDASGGESGSHRLNPKTDLQVLCRDSTPGGRLPKSSQAITTAAKANRITAPAITANAAPTKPMV